MLLTRRSLESQQQNSDIFIKKTDGIASVFAIFLLDDFRFTIPKAVFILGIVKCTSNQFYLIIHVCPAAPLRWFVIAVNLRRKYASTSAID
jgi:hypothetical protein